jgi:N-acetyl sugar amidotransferase
MSHPLGLTLDEDGVCSGCRIHEEKDALDWESRWVKLKNLVSPYRVASGRTYDCIVPVSGGGDSYYIVYLVKERLGLNPLLVTYNKYFNTALGIRNLANLRVKFNCDILYQNINPISVRKITRTTLRELGSIYWPCLAGQTVFPVQTAIRYKIPLIIWGAHQGLEQVGMFSHSHEVEMNRRYRKDHDLMGFEADDLLSIFDTITEDDVWQYRYPDDASLYSVGVRGIYLGNYVRWDPKAQHEKMVRQFGYQGGRFGRTFDIFDHVDCYNFMDLHDKIKLLKHGFSKVTDHACREIRHGRLSRDEGLDLVGRYQQAPLQHAERFCDWLGLNPQGMNFILDKHRNLSFWREKSQGVWEFLPDIVGSSLPVGKSALWADASITGRQQTGSNKRQYVTFGKGWP